MPKFVVAKKKKIDPKEIKNIVYDGFDCKEVPKDYLQYSNAKKFVFSRNKLAKFPKEILKAFPKLQLLDLSTNPFIDIPAEISELKELKELILSYNNHTDFPESMAQLKKLQKISMFYSYKLKKIPDVVAKIPSLIELNFARTDNLASMPEDIGNLTKLEHLNLEECTLLTKLPASFGKLTNLKYLNLDGTSIKKLPEGFENFINLEELYISIPELDVEDTIKKIKNLPKLKILKIMFQQKYPKSLKDLKFVTSLTVGENYPLLRKKHATFPIPAEIATIPNIEVLDFTNCNLANQLPKNIGDMTKLRILDISTTSIKNFPESLKKLKNLTAIEGSMEREDSPQYGIKPEQKEQLQQWFPKAKISFY